VTIDEIKERLQRITAPLYPYYRDAYRKFSTEHLSEMLTHAEKDLIPQTWHTGVEWDFCTEHEFDSYTCCRAIRDEIAERLGYLERELIQEQIGYDF
jgi:hypothetical protein